MTASQSDERQQRAAAALHGQAGLRSTCLRLDRKGHIVEGDAGLSAWLGYSADALDRRHVSSVVPALAGDALTGSAQPTQRLTLFAEFAVTLKGRDAGGADVPCRLHVDGVVPSPEGPVLCVRLDEIPAPWPAGLGASRTPFPRPR